MLYRVYPQTGLTKLYTEPHSGSRLPYRTVKQMRELYPHDDFTVIGEIGGFARPPNDRDKLLAKDDKVLSILPRGSLKRPFEWVAGYVAVGKGTYLAAIRGVIPAFSRPSAGKKPNHKGGKRVKEKSLRKRIENEEDKR